MMLRTFPTFILQGSKQSRGCYGLSSLQKEYPVPLTHYTELRDVLVNKTLNSLKPLTLLTELHR